MLTREAWLTGVVKRFRVWFVKEGKPLPDLIRVSVGWPSSGGRSRKNRAIGECWSSTSSEDGAVEIFISPALGDASRVCDVLLHELVHAAVGCGAGHGGAFRRLATSLGLEGKMTATVASEELRSAINSMLANLPPYPHAKLVARQTVARQTTRMLKVSCPDCGYTVRTTRRWLEVAIPVCPVHSTEMVYERGSRDAGGV